MLPEPIVEQLLAFRRDRDWEQFHSPKNLAIAVTVEAAELLEQFQWTLETGSTQIPAERIARIREEVADVAILLTYLVQDLGIDIDEAVRDKLASNATRYPVDISRGRAVKYDQL